MSKMRKFRFRCKSLAIAKLTLLALIVSVPINTLHAIPTDWDINFVDDSNNPTGDGIFSFDPDTETNITAEYPPFFSESITVNTEIENIQITVLGQEWTNEDASHLFWADDIGNEQHPAGFVFDPGTGSFITEDNSWFLGDHELGTEILIMDFDSGDQASGSGNWFMSVFNGPNEPFTIGSGSWSAAPVVPIPASLPLMGIGLAGLLWARKKCLSD